MQQLIHTFYESFAALDAEAMVACYHDEIIFEDPAFGRLYGEKAKAMWRMLLQSQQGKEFTVTHSQVEGNAKSGSAHWEARYHFGKDKRPVHNRIEARFQFEDGKIIRHTDHFDLYAWSRQAMGFSGWLMGWTDFFRKRLQGATDKQLAAFLAKQQTR
ncbi:MAG: nuclear transport factor 2 family protein [Bacteroidota bacterium]